MKISVLAATAKVAFLFLLAQSFAGQAAEVTVFSGGGLRSAMTELAPMFERTIGHKVVVTFDSNDGLERRIKAGESFDVLLIGAPTFALLGDKIAPAPRVLVGRAGLGVGVRAGASKPDIASVDSLKRALLGANSVSHVGDGQSGVLFLALLDRLGIAEPMKPKLKPTTVANVVKAVASGEADLVVHNAPQILAEPGVELVGAIPAEIRSTIDATAGLSAAAKEPEAGKAFIAFLTSDPAMAVIKAKGWEPAAP
ncbi:MAG: substrate-binding domain-containing protein [Pseudomonadota bacterium]|nr:substrate-binding domain-containing protein [Pseudomonadota bacterium]